jgi:uncharacterized membrane protein HdeD (DUF308 family)
MSKKTLTIIIGVTGAVCTCASTIIAVFNPSWEAVAVGIISAVNTCIDAICAVLVKNTPIEQKKLDK